MLEAARVKRLGPGIALCIAIAVLAQSLAGLPALKVLGPLTLALLLGMTFRAAAGMPGWADAGSRFCARPVLRAGVFLMGARLDYALVQRVGARVLLLDLAIIVAGITGIAWLGRRLGVRSGLAVLLAVGTSICGASAVVAAGSVTRADEEEVTLAVALCGVLGTLGALFYIFAGPHLPLSTSQLAVLTGSTLHEVAQVVAAAFTFGAASGDLGTLVKLTRVVLLAPALIALGALSKAGGERPSYSLKNPPIPWFVIGFLVLGAVSTFLPRPVKDTLGLASVFLMAAAMAAMGLHVPFAMLRRAGVRVVYAGVLGFAGLAVLSATLIHLLGIQ